MMRSAWILYGLLVLASVVYGLGLFTGLECWGRGDWDQFSFRYETPRTAMLRDRQLPLWNPYVNGGNVLAAHPHCPAFSPWYLPTLALGAPLGLRVQVVLFVALGATGIAAVLRRWGVSSAGCFAGGVLMMMSAHFTMHVTEGHLEWCVLGLMPWVLLCLVRAQQDRRFVIFGSLVLASALLHGSIYVMAVFVPLFVVWAGLESVRTRSWRTVLSCAGVLGLTFLVCAVVVFPRMEFLRANPRDTRRHEQIAFAALGRMLVDPGQADLYRATRDVRNPPDVDLARLLPDELPLLARKYETQKWHRLEVEFSTTSDWTDLRFEGFPYILFMGEEKVEDKTTRQLNLMSLSTEGMALQNPTPGESKGLHATLYARLPERGDVQFAITRGTAGASRLTVTRGEEVLLERLHAARVTGDTKNRRTFAVPRNVILAKDRLQQGPDGPWYQLEATLTTTADWCEARVVKCPYLFRVESPEYERQAPLRASTRPFVLSKRPSGEKEATLRAILCFQSPGEDGLRVRIIQGRLGATTLKLKTREGEQLTTVCKVVTDPGGEKTYEYLLPEQVIRERLEPLPTPWRWQLDRWGMADDWHEYGCYATWVGLGVAVCGLIVSFRRQWPLYATGMVAGLIALGAALPVNLWGLWKLLPMFGSLQVPSRHLVAVVFVTAICGGYGVACLGRWGERLGGAWLRRLLECGLVLAIYVELAVLAWNLFSDIFVCPPRPVPAHEDRGFAQRYAEDEVRYAAMYSAHYPYLLDNSGVLREYENIAIPRGKIRLVGDPDYQGEVWLESSKGKAQIAGWSMSRVNAALQVDTLDRLVLNQNCFRGWKAVRRGPEGTVEKLPAEPGPKGSAAEGLVSLGVRPGDREVEFYYLPDSFLFGAVVSGLALVGCLGLLLFGSGASWLPRKLTPWVAAVRQRCAGFFRPRAVRYLACAVVLNLPFVLCHPGWTLADVPLVRSLAVGAVLLLAPGLPLVGVMIARGWLPRFGLLWAIAASFVVFVAVLVVTHLAGLPLGASGVWNGTWALMNLAIVLNVALGGPPACGIELRDAHWRVTVPLFVLAYVTFFFGATRVVPPMDDHDLDVQGPGYALLSRFRPEVVNDRKLLYYFAHPLLLNCYEAASFLYYGQLDHLERFDKVTDRVRRTESGEISGLIGTTFCWFSENHLGRDRGNRRQGMSRHQIVGVKRGSYVFDSPLRKWRGRDRVWQLPVREFEVQILYDDYEHDPRRLQTRTPNIFLAATTVALLGCWIGRLSGRWWLGLLVPAVYATSPEVFVRSSYGGYFAISMFAAVQILLAIERRMSHPGRAAWMTCLLAGIFAALVNNKLVLLPAALVVWEFSRPARTAVAARLSRAIGHPVVLGFLLGTVAFWIYGLAISPRDFWADYARIHLVDRVTHHNPLGYRGYPTVFGLWREFGEHTGYVLLPFGIAVLGLLCWKRGVSKDASESGDMTGGWRGVPGLWVVWAALTAAAFTLIDWRQTKHLMPLLLPLHLAPAYWAASGRAALGVVTVIFCGLLLWNLATLSALVSAFDQFTITPAW